MEKVLKYMFIERFNEPVLTPSPTLSMISRYEQFSNDNRFYVMSPCYMSSTVLDFQCMSSHSRLTTTLGVRDSNQPHFPIKGTKA